MRMTLAFALGALAVSLTLATLTYELARTYLLRQREAAAVRQAVDNAEVVVDAPDRPFSVLERLTLAQESYAVLFRAVPPADEPQWIASHLQRDQRSLPDPLIMRVARERRDGLQRFSTGGQPQLGVGLPIPSVANRPLGVTAYFEVVSLQELSKTLGVLRNSLAVAALVAAAAGAAIGRWTSRRVLHPVAAVADAAKAVASGRLDVRLDVGDDPDLAAVATAFNSMTDALEERIQRDARFASAVSHELRSPLTTLATSLEVICARREELPERARTALDLLASEVQRFQRLVQDLLEISRIDAGPSTVAWERVRLGEFVLQALRTTRKRGFFVDLPPDAATAVVRADKRRLERVVANLVDNAEHYGGGVVRVALRRSDGALQVAVDDAGPGVPTEEREHIFERFVRGRAAGRRGAGEGTGLGLALVAEHVKLHGGRVWVEDRPGGGARFIVQLPLADS